MRPIEYIRRNIFKTTQMAFGEVAGATQATVSRWESGELEPGREEMTRIRTAAQQIGEWNDSWFFEIPATAEATA